MLNTSPQSKVARFDYYIYNLYICYYKDTPEGNFPTRTQVFTKQAICQKE